MWGEVKEEGEDVCALYVRYARAKVECLASVDAVLIGRRWGVRLASSYPVAGGEGIDGTRGLHDQQWCWV